MKAKKAELITTSTRGAYVLTDAGRMLVDESVIAAELAPAQDLDVDEPAIAAEPEPAPAQDLDVDEPAIAAELAPTQDLDVDEPAIAAEPELAPAQDLDVDEPAIAAEPAPLLERNVDVDEHTARTSRLRISTDDDEAPRPAALPALLKRRGRTLAAKRITKEEQRIGALLWPERSPRPRTRGECSDVPRPCPFVGCRHHLFLDVQNDSSLKFRHAEGVEPWDIEESCSLDIADRGPHTLEDVGRIMGITRERTRQIETTALEHGAHRIIRMGVDLMPIPNEREEIV